MSAMRDLLLEAKQHGFADKQLAFLWHSTEMEIRRLRKELGVVPSLQARRYLRRRVRGVHAVLLFDV